MKFYAYVPDKNGNEPMGTFGSFLIDLKTLRGAINRVKSYGKTNFRIFTYTNFYDEKTFTKVYEQ